LKLQKQFLPLTKKKRYKGAKGGRASGKSFFFADCIVRVCTKYPVNVVCVREIQKSIKFSSKKLIEDEIKKYNVQDQFEITQNEIRSKAGGVIIFQGMQDHTADSIKSLEGFDICWVEEAQNISKYSLELLIPTIRKENSEIWFSWNPRYEDDPIEVFFNSLEDNFALVHANYTENKLLSDTVLKEAERHRIKNPETFDHVWLGDYSTISDAQIFKNKYEIKDFEINNSFGEPLFGIDFGFAKDPTTGVECYIKDNNLYIYNEAYKVGLELDYTAEYLTNHMPKIADYKSRADSARPESISYLKRHGLSKIEGVKKWSGSVEDGVEFLKSFDCIYIHTRCVKTAEEFRKYSYKTDKRTGDILPKIEDDWNHIIDACFSGDTTVIVNNKKMLFKDIPEKGLIKGFNGKNIPYFNGGYIRHDKLCTLKLNNGKIIKCTFDHEFLTTDGKWTKAIDLKGKTLCESSLFQKQNKTSMEKDINCIKEKNISLEEIKDFIGLFGNIITQKSQKTNMSTIKTIIQKITTLKTLCLLINQNIIHCTLKSFIKTILLLQKDKWKRISKNVKSGINLVKDIIGIKNTMRKTKINSSQKKIKNVNVAEKNLMDLKERAIYFVQQSAKQNGEEIADLMMSKEDVSVVAKHLWQTNIQKNKIVVESVEESQQEEKTYCVTVPNNECFSLENNIVVSNCRYALNPFIRNNKTTIKNIEVNFA